MKNTVIYASKTGHSKKIANAIAKELNCQAKSTKENPQLNEVDTLFVVGGVYGSQSLPELLAYLKGLNNQMVKKAVLITSSASKTMKQEEVRNILKQQGILVEEEEYTCQGAFLVMGLGHPNKEEISQAVMFAKGKATV